MLGVSRGRLVRVQGVAQRGCAHAEPVRAIAIAADAAATIGMALVVEGHDGGIGDEGRLALVLNPHRCSRKDETVSLGRTGVGESRMARWTAKLSDLDERRLEENSRGLGGVGRLDAAERVPLGAVAHADAARRLESASEAARTN